MESLFDDPTVGNSHHGEIRALTEKIESRIYDLYREGPEHPSDTRRHAGDDESDDSDQPFHRSPTASPSQSDLGKR